MNNTGDVLSSSLLALSWPGDRCPRKAVGLVGPGPQGPKQSSDEAPACVEETVATKERIIYLP